MIAIFIKLFPYLVLAYFLYRSVREPIYIAGIPFLFLMRYSIFFENVKIFAIPGRYSPDILFIAWLIVFWLIIRNINIDSKDNNIKNYVSSGKLTPIDYLIFFLILISVIDLILVVNDYIVQENVFIEFITMSSLFIGFYIIKDIFRRFDPVAILKFIFSIVFLNSIASLLYVLHQGFHFQIYMYEEYLEEYYQGIIITRTFWFMPVLSYFSIAFLLVYKKENSVLIFILLIINILGLFISYSRSSIMNATLVIIAFYILQGYKQKNLYNVLKNMLIIIIVGISLFIAVSQLLPASTNYFVDRFSELQDNPNSDESNSLLYRFGRTNEVIKDIQEDKLLTGFGPVTEKQIPWVEEMHAITADMAWTEVAFRWGYLGLFLFFLLFIFSLLKSFRLFIHSEGGVSSLSLILLITTISQISESFTSFAFIAPDRMAMGLWYIALLSALNDIYEKKKKLNADQEIVQ